MGPDSGITPNMAHRGTGENIRDNFLMSNSSPGSGLIRTPSMSAGRFLLQHYTAAFIRKTNKCIIKSESQLCSATSYPMGISSSPSRH